MDMFCWTTCHIIPFFCMFFCLQADESDEVILPPPNKTKVFLTSRKSVELMLLFDHCWDSGLQNLIAVAATLW